MNVRQSFGDRLHALASEHGWSQAEVARRSRVSRPVINRIVKGRRPTPEQLRGLMIAFDQTALALVKGTDAEEVVGDELLRPSPDQQREALEGAVKAKAELALARAELDEQHGALEHLNGELAHVRQQLAEHRVELAAKAATEQELHGRLKEAQEFGSKWAATSLGQAGRIHALEKTNAALTSENAALQRDLQKIQQAYAILWEQHDKTRQQHQQLALQTQSQPNPAATALASGVVGFALASLLLGGKG